MKEELNSVKVKERFKNVLLVLSLLLLLVQRMGINSKKFSINGVKNEELRTSYYNLL